MRNKLPPRLKLQLIWFKIKKHIWCRWFKKWHRRCYPEVWVGGDITRYHCFDCMPCGFFMDHLSEIIKYNDHGPECRDCLLPYINFDLDTTLPDDQWREVSKGVDLLCANCIVKRASKLPGVVATRMVIEIVK